MTNIIEIECPFCKRNSIKIVHSSAIYGSQTIRVGSNRKTVPKLTPEKTEILSSKCSNCGKSKKEIEKALKQGKQPYREEVLRRMKEAGLPLKI